MEPNELKAIKQIQTNLETQDNKKEVDIQNKMIKTIKSSLIQVNNLAGDLKFFICLEKLEEAKLKQKKLVLKLNGLALSHLKFLKSAKRFRS